MNKEQAQEKIKDILEKMGYSDIIFREIESGFCAAFNSEEVTSFVTDIEGWKYSGVQLDPLKERQYKIDFKKLS